MTETVITIMHVLLFYGLMSFELWTHLDAYRQQPNKERLGRSLHVPLALGVFLLFAMFGPDFGWAWVLSGLTSSFVLLLTQPKKKLFQLFRLLSTYWLGSAFLFFASIIFFIWTTPMMLAIGWSLTALIVFVYARFKAPRTLAKTFQTIPYRYTFKSTLPSFWQDRLYLVKSKKLRLPMNALLLGHQNAKIMFSAPLLARLKSQHIEGVIAHEIGHHIHRHLRQRMLLISAFIVLFYAFGVLTLQGQTLTGEPFIRYLTGATIWLLTFKYTLVALLHHQEYQADAYASNQDLAHSLSEALVIIDHYLKSTHPSVVYNKTQQTHPITQRRIERLQKEGHA